MQTDETTEQVIAQVGGYLLMQYRDERGTLAAANAVSALGAWAGVFAQVQARALLYAGVIPTTKTSLLEVKTTDGQRFYFGDAINACVLEGSEKAPSFWNLAAAAAKDPDIVAKVDPIEIARRTAQGVGGAMFGQPRIDPAYQLTERPIDSVRAHAPALNELFIGTALKSSKLMLVFGAVAQHFAGFAAGEMADIRADTPMKRVDIVRLYIESAVPMSKLDLTTLGMAPEPEAR